jgi:hypothetical protein
MPKFTPVDLSPYLNAGRDNAPLAPGARAPWQPVLGQVLPTMLAGEQTIWGVPFHIAPPTGQPCWLALGAGADSVEISLGAAVTASYVLILHFCNSSQDEQVGRPRNPLQNHVMRPGEHLADYTLIYTDKSTHTQPIRRRFEINEPTVAWGQGAFAARPDIIDQPADPLGAHVLGAWGRNQQALKYTQGLRYPYWVYALPNPHPEKRISALHVQASGADTFAIAAITLFHGKDHPLRHHRLETVRATLPHDEAALPGQIPADIDLGVIVRRYAVPDFQPEQWLSAAVKGWGEEAKPAAPVTQLLIDVTASPDATLSTGAHAVEMGDLFTAGAASSSGAHFELLTPHKQWLHVTVIDDTTGKPTPARVHFRAPDGRYFPPYGHRHEVNDNWFEDYGADLKLGSTQYAYVDGTFQIELPVGRCYAEASKGFEFEGLRQELNIQPGQRELTLHLARHFDLRRQGWVTADTHVHFITPQTAWLEGQAEGLNVINLLASQWGDLFTNVGDLTGGQSGCSRDGTLVWVGTENREHVLGHMSLLGVKGDPIMPLCVGGPDESYFGDPMWTSLTEWADRCRKQDGLVVIPHFPTPYAEVVASIILGKVDGVELREFYAPTLNNYNLLEWYRFLNLGQRVAAVGGTDKMSAGMPVGGVRTYARLGDDEFTYDNWAKAVRAGHTFTTSGPLIDISVDGKSMGDSIHLPAGGGTLEVQATARSVAPFHVLQIVRNGQVIAEQKADAGACEARLSAHVRVDSSSWVAARCLSMLKLWHCWPVQMAAHTSPVYITVDDREQFSPSDATYMLTMLDGGLTWLDTLSIPANPERQADIKAFYQQAKHSLEHRLHAHNHEHGRAHEH